MKKGILIACMVGAILGVCAFIHRRVILALIRGEELPKAPAWHFWCKNRA